MTDSVFSLIPQNINFVFINKLAIEGKKVFNDKYFIAAFTQFILSSSIFNYIQSKKSKDKINNEENVFNNLTLSFLDNFQGFLFSYLSGDALTVMQKMRIIYESYAIFLFIHKYKVLVKPFLDHIKIIENKIYKDMPGYKNDEIDSLIKSYGYGFLDNYGWTKDVIKNTSDRNLKYIASDVGLDSLDTIYKVTSNFIHTNAFSAFLKKQITPNYVSQYIPIMSSIL